MRNKPRKQNGVDIYTKYNKIVAIISSSKTNAHYNCCLNLIENYIKTGCFLLEKDLLTFWGAEALQRTTQHLKNAYDDIETYLKTS